jgi:hypothetical protein
MEKFILVPYEKYQRMLQPKTKGFGEVTEDEPTKVSLPPPGERKKSTKKAGKSQKTKIDWISF